MSPCRWWLPTQPLTRRLAYIALSLMRSLHGKFDRLADVSLDEAKPEREKNVRAEQKNQQRWSPDKIAELSDKFFEFLHKTPCLRGKNYRFVVRKVSEKMAYLEISAEVIGRLIRSRQRPYPSKFPFMSLGARRLHSVKRQSS